MVGHTTLQFFYSLRYQVLSFQHGVLPFIIRESINISGFKFVCEVYELEVLPFFPMGERKLCSATLACSRNKFGGSRVARHWFRGSD